MIKTNKIWHKLNIQFAIVYNVAKTMKGGLAKGTSDLSGAKTASTIPIGMGRSTMLGGNTTSITPIAVILVCASISNLSLYLF